MEKFWIIGVANQYNTLNERFYTYEEAVAEAEKRASIDPSKIYNVLELKGYAEGELTPEIEYNPANVVLILEFYQGESAKITIRFTDSKGNPLDLSNCSVQFIVLPSPTSEDSDAIFNETKKYVDSSITPVPSDSFTGNTVNFIVSSEVTKNVGIYWYQVRVIYHTDPSEMVVYQENKFIVK